MSFLSQNTDQDEYDYYLLNRILNSDRGALDILIRRYQDWIYNIVFRMVVNHQDAEDITQEVLLKMIINLSTFNQKSSFKTWLYRIAVNHIIDMKRKKREQPVPSFANHEVMLESMGENEIQPVQYMKVDNNILVEETRIGCMMGMLLCLDRGQRLVFIIGGIMGADSVAGAEIMNITPSTFRKRLSRARSQLLNYLNGRCGLMNEENICRCSKKLKGAIEKGYVDPASLKFQRGEVKKIKEMVENYIEDFSVSDLQGLRVDNYFREHPFMDAPDFTGVINGLLERLEVQRLLNFS